MMAVVGSDASFDQGREQMQLLAGIEVTRKAVERHAEAIGGEIERRHQIAIQRAVQLDLPEIGGKAIPVLYIEMDGTGVPVYSSNEFLELARSSPAAEPADVSDGATAVVLFTSGTTSRPKGVLLRHQNLTSYVLQTVEFASAAEDEAALVTTPPYHVAGFGAILSNLYAGRRIVYLPGFSPAGWLEAVRSEEITSAMVVPTMLARIVDHLDGAPADAPSLRALAYGVHIRIILAGEIIAHHNAALHDQTRALGHIGIGSDAGRDHNHIAIQTGSVFECESGNVVFA